MNDAGVIEICYCQQKMAGKQKSILDTIAGRHCVHVTRVHVCLCVYACVCVQTRQNPHTHTV